MKTEVQARRELLEHVRTMVRYWSDLPGDMSVADRCDGVAFSVLSMLDGASAIPHITLAVSPGAEDDGYPADMILNDGVELHEEYSAIVRAEGAR